MRGFWIFILILFILWLLGMLSIKLKIKGSNEEFEAKLKILFFSFKFGGNNKKEKKPKKEKEPIKKAEPEKKRKKAPQKKKKKKLSFGSIISMIKPVPKVLRYFLRGIKADKVVFILRISGEDASQTAIQYGRACAAAYPLLAFCKTQMKVKVKEFVVEPDFYHDKTHCRAEGILSIRLYRILFGGIWYLGSVIKNFLSKATPKTTNKNTAAQAA